MLLSMPWMLWRSVAMTHSLRDRIAEQLARDIDAARWLPGEQLPGERVLAQRLGVSRPVVREALRIIEGAGLVRIDAMRGAFVRLEVGGELALTGHLVASLSKLSLSHFAEARGGIVGHIASLAAQNALEADIEGLSFYLEMMARALDNPELFKQADIAFHRQLSVATQNPIYVAWIDVVLRALNQKRYDATRLDEVRVRILECHRGIFEAVSAGDPEAARRAIEAHIVQFVNDERGRPIPLARGGPDVGGALGAGPRTEKEAIVERQHPPGLRSWRQAGAIEKAACANNPGHIPLSECHLLTGWSLSKCFT